MGADALGYHRRQDCTDLAPFDRILDLVATRSPFARRGALAPGGRYQPVGGAVGTLLSVATIGTVVGRSTGRRVGVLTVKQGPTEFEPSHSIASTAT